MATNPPISKYDLKDGKPGLPEAATVTAPPEKGLADTGASNRAVSLVNQQGLNYAVFKIR